VVVADAAERGFRLFPGSLFFVNAPETNWMRFNMGWANDKRLFQYFAERLPLLRKAVVSQDVQRLVAK
jgi:DNA-binding transcriptional MocR family regulator